MSINANITIPLVGQVHTLTVTDVSNWAEVMDHVSINTHAMSTQYDGVTYTGVISKTSDSMNLLMVFDVELITLPSGACILIECPEEEEENDHDHCDDTVIFGDDLGELTRLAVLDSDGCPIGMIQLGALIDYIETQLNIPGTLCELLNVGEIPQGNLLGPDRILTTSSGCTLKSVPQSDLAC